jgi:N-acetylneuraminic acid mutarotase
VTDTWSDAGNMVNVSFDTSAVLLPNGKVLVPAGADAGYHALAHVEQFDPATKSWSIVGSLSVARRLPTITLLPNGKVLVAGGMTTAGVPFASAEIYDPMSNTASSAGTMATARYLAVATLLPNGKVLVSGGISTMPQTAVASAELYDPATNTWSSAGALVTGRYYVTQTLLPNRKVLVVGGVNGNALPAFAELYDVTSNTWSVAGLAGSRGQATATLLSNGQVLVAGGYGPSAQLYDPATNRFLSLPSLGVSRSAATATLLPSGKVLLAGGIDANTLIVIASTQLFDIGLGFDNARRPMLANATDPLQQGSALALTGSLFRGDTEASNGSSNSSPTNYPLVQLRRVDNEQLKWAGPDPLSFFSATAWTSSAANGLQPGPHLATMFVNGIPGISRMINVTPGISPMLQSVTSRKLHGTAGTFDLPLSQVATNPTTEPRRGPAAIIVMTFDAAILSANVAVTEGAASVGAVTFSGNDVIVSLAGVADQQYVAISATNVTSAVNTGGSGSIRVGFLVGDVNQDGVVTVSDLGLVNAQLAQPVTASNFLKDVSASGALTVADKGITNANLAKALPPP